MDASELAGIADQYYTAREERLAADRTAAKLKEKESELKAAILAAMGTNNMSAVGGALCVLNRKEKIKPVAMDWKEVFKYMKENDAFDLVQKRLTEGAVNVRWEDGIDIPGIGSITLYDLTVSKPK